MGIKYLKTFFGSSLVIIFVVLVQRIMMKLHMLFFCHLDAICYDVMDASETIQ